MGKVFKESTRPGKDSLSESVVTRQGVDIDKGHR